MFKSKLYRPKVNFSTNQICKFHNLFSIFKGHFATGGKRCITLYTIRANDLHLKPRIRQLAIRLTGLPEELRPDPV
jgi:hypothetical protein